MRVAFAERLDRIEQARAPFAQALRAALSTNADSADPVEPDLLIFTPRDDEARVRTPDSVLALTSSGWLLIEEGSDGRPSVTKSGFSETVGVELTGILLYGRLDILYARGSVLQHAVVVFNTVMYELFSEAAERVLRGTRGLTGEAGLHSRKAAAGMDELPFKFRSALLDVTPAGEQVRALFFWPMAASRGHLWLCHELAPAGLLILTEHNLLIVREEINPGLIWRKARPHYGKIVTYVPLSRVRGYFQRHLDDLPLFAVALQLSARAPVADTLGIEFPQNRSAGAQAFLGQLVDAAHAAISQPGATDTRAGSPDASRRRDHG